MVSPVWPRLCRGMRELGDRCYIVVLVVHSVLLLSLCQTIDCWLMRIITNPYITLIVPPPACLQVRGQLAAMANLLTVNAIRVGQDPNAQSPFAVAAKQAGKHWCVTSRRV